ncbi:hypothetical protein ABZ479_27660 [Streptomyces sp. NPDC005722]
MADTTPPRRRPAVSVLVVWPVLSLAGWGAARLLGGPEDLVNSVVKVGTLMAAVAAVDSTRRGWQRRRTG